MVEFDKDIDSFSFDCMCPSDYLREENGKDQCDSHKTWFHHSQIKRAIVSSI